MSDKPKRLTRKGMLHTLMTASVHYIAGAGCGIRRVATEKEKEEIREAVKKAYVEIYGH